MKIDEKQANSITISQKISKQEKISKQKVKQYAKQK